MKHGIIQSLLLAVATLVALAQEESARYPGWRHTGSLHILTTPDGADLPAGAMERDFPLLVRLYRDFFDLSQARADGSDVRFSTSAGTPLAYQVEEWDPVSGTAGIWVRVLVVRGDDDQEIRVHRGRADAASGSDGPAVFNASNGYLSVWHMGGVVKDEVGTLESKAVARRAEVARPPDLPGNPCPSREPRRLSRHGRPAGTGPCQPFVASPDLARRWC